MFTRQHNRVLVELALFVLV